MARHVQNAVIPMAVNFGQIPIALIEHANSFRMDAARNLSAAQQAEWGQFFTPLPVAQFMASMFGWGRGRVSLLDAGAGTGALTAAFVAEACRQPEPPAEIMVTAYEIDAALITYLKSTLESCRVECERNEVVFKSDVIVEDFIGYGSERLRERLFEGKAEGFTHAILNPPYRKINSDSETRRLLRGAGIETSNLYTAFLAIITRLLDRQGELVAITPRSFCNGSYFKLFRRAFLEEMSFARIHIFEARDLAFGENEVLQENIIFHAVKRPSKNAKVIISSSAGPEDEAIAIREVEAGQLVRHDDPDSFIHIAPDELGSQIADLMGRFTCSLSDLGLRVSTGRVVDFRAREHLQYEKAGDGVPLIYPHHFAKGYISHPKAHQKKPNWITENTETTRALVAAGRYVLVKRFSAKEERKRVVAALYDPADVAFTKVGFENHLNYFHDEGGGLGEVLARGLVAFLNSNLVDNYFRQFNGHTQVNAADLRSIKYPSKQDLELLGESVGGGSLPDQNTLDQLVWNHLLNMTDANSAPILARRKIEEAMGVLKAVGFPKKQQNERSALTLLALLDLHPEKNWAEADHPLRGVTQMMDFFAAWYGKRYAPNSRETVRRQTIHQFLAAGLIVANPDQPQRPINSGKTVYQIEEGALKLLRTFDGPVWETELHAYLASRKTLQEKYAQIRRMNRIPITMPTGQTLTLSAGGQNVLIAKIIEEFCPHFTPGGKVIYVGDADQKWAIFDEEAFKLLKIAVDAHGKMPDVVVHHVEKNWLILIEAVTSHRPVNAQRRDELKNTFKHSPIGLVFVTAFLTRKTMVRYLNEISWETEVWIAEAPTHMIHFNGERFLGPYEI